MKNFKNVLILASTLFLFAACGEKPENTSEVDAEAKTISAPALINKTLMKETLALAENIEVITSYVEIPPNTTLPLHFHPGEEFAYVVEGTGTVIIDGQEDKVVKAGEMGMIPFKSHHTFSTTDETVKIVVFRVHEKGQPERTLVENNN